MNHIDWRNHVEVSPDIHHGDPCIKGTRIPVTTIVGSLADGMTTEEIVNEYPQISEIDVQAALAYAAETLT
jgi:uncharacterized protein (DUF433 family)